MYKKTGKLIHKDIQRGTSKANKPWTKMTFVIDNTTDPKYPKLVAFDTFKGDIIEFVNDTTDGTQLEVEFEVESREWNGRYFSNINAIGAQVVRGNGNQYQSNIPEPTEEEDLPF